MKKMMIRFSLVLIVIFPLGAASAQVGGEYLIKVSYDEFEGMETISSYNNYLPGGMGVALNPVRITSDSGFVKYSFVVTYTGRDWIFIGEGETLFFLVDGERMPYSGLGSGRFRQIEGGFVREAAFYDLLLVDMRKIVEADVVKVKIKASQQRIERQLSQRNLDNIREFIEFCEAKDSTAITDSLEVIDE